MDICMSKRFHGCLAISDIPAFLKIAFIQLSIVGFRLILNPASFRSAPLCRTCFTFAIHSRCCSQHVASDARGFDYLSSQEGIPPDIGLPKYLVPLYDND